MAEKLDSFRFSRGPRTGYPWDEWLDGSIWRLTRGVDFDAKVESIRQIASRKAEKRGLRVRTSSEGDWIVLQAFSREEGE